MIQILEFFNIQGVWIGVEENGPAGQSLLLAVILTRSAIKP